VPATSQVPPDWLETLQQPLVYVTLGTVFNKPELFRPLLQGLDGSVSALVTTGRNVDPQSLGSWPPSVRVERFVPQAHVLPRCAAVVAHAGSGSVLGALAHGLPLVLVPQGADQFDNAARCAAAGAAVVIAPEELTAEAVRAALKRVLDEPSFAEAARRVQAEIDAMPTSEEVASRLEEYVAAG
jgi:MGT family glycosyltransferase